MVTVDHFWNSLHQINPDEITYLMVPNMKRSAILIKKIYVLELDKVILLKCSRNEEVNMGPRLDFLLP